MDKRERNRKSKQLNGKEQLSNVGRSDSQRWCGIGLEEEAWVAHSS